MERYESGSMAASGSHCPPPASVTSLQGSTPANFFLISRAAQHAHSGIGEDSLPWQDVLYVTRALVESEQRLSSQSVVWREAHRIPSDSPKGMLEDHLKNLERSLDKLLSSFHAVVNDPADDVHDPSLSLASCRSAAEAIPRVLAIGSSLALMNAGIEALSTSSQAALRSLSKDDDAAMRLQQTSGQLDLLEKQVSALEAAVDAFASVSQTSEAAAEAINNRYVTLTPSLS